ncbi:MAG: shikimate dehydrogenase [Balneolales bacterium]|nr:shikimate dehydrogenase [Balneolales bacterium]
MNSVYPLDQFLNSKLIDKPFVTVIGNPIGHSLSPLIHNAALNLLGIGVTYYAILVEEQHFELLPKLFSHPNFVGSNVTIPFKSRVIPLLENISDDVTAMGACNSIYYDENRTLTGANTDVNGFLRPLLHNKDRFSNKDAIVFGSGGASKAIVYGLMKIGIRKCYVISRNPKPTTSSVVENVGYAGWIDLVKDAELIVNATPLGMHPNLDESPISDAQAGLLTDKVCYDIIYRPLQTRFLNQAKDAGAEIVNGSEMFLGQADEAFTLFTGKSFPLDEIKTILYKELES